jgi:hypothetical protein
VWFTIRAPSCLKGLPVVVRSKSGVVERTGIPGESGPTGKLERGGHVDGKDPNRLLCLGGEPVSLEEVCPDLGPQCNKASLWDIVGSLSCPAKTDPIADGSRPVGWARGAEWFVVFKYGKATRS